MWDSFAPRGHSRNRSNVIGTPCASEGSGLSMTWTCTCGCVELPELPQLAIGCPTVTSSPTRTPMDPVRMWARATKWSLCRSAMVTWLPAMAAIPWRSRACWPSAYGTSVSCERRAT